MMVHQPDLAARLRGEMDRRGLTIDALAERSGLARNTVGEITRRNAAPTIETVRALATALGVEPGWLAFGTR